MNNYELANKVKAGLSQREIAKCFNVSQSTIKYWLKKFGINTQKKQFNIKCDYRCKFCGVCDEKLFAKRHGKICHTICLKCDADRAIERARESKVQSVNYKGGKCVECGYDKCLAALEFHHVDPESKDINFDKMKFWSLKRRLAELDKCVLLCSNCHREKHAAMM